MRTLVFLPVGVALLAAPREGEAGGRGGAAAELEHAALQAAAAPSYTFAIDEQPGGGTGGAFTGKYVRGQPTYFQADGIDFFRQGQALAYAQGGQWHRSKSCLASDPLRILGAAAKVRRTRLPHEELAGFAKHIQRVRKAQEKGQAVYSGDLTDAAVKRLAPTEFRPAARSGQARVWVAGGQVTKYAVTLRLEGRLGNAEIDGTAQRTVTLSDAGRTAFAVPAEARKVLE
jgi:hypothetical protein